MDRDDPLLERTDAYARRVFRDTHPLDNDPSRGFDDGNGQRIMLGSMGVKATAGDSATLLPPVRTFDTLTTDAVGGLYYSFEKFGIQVESAEFTAGADPSANHPPQPAKRSQEIAIADVQRGEPLRLPRRPLRRLRLHRQLRLHRGEPALRLRAGERGRLPRAARQPGRPDRHRPARPRPDPGAGGRGPGHLHRRRRRAELRHHRQRRRRAGHPPGAGAGDQPPPAARRTPRRTTAPARTPAASPRRSCTAPTGGSRWPSAVASDPVLGSAPAVQYRAAGLPRQRRRAEPEVAQRVLPADVDRSTGSDGTQRLHPRSAGRASSPLAVGAGRARALHAVRDQQPLLLRPDSRVGQRREQAAYGAAIVDAHRGRRRSRPGGLRRGPERLPPPRRPDRHRREPDPVGPARAALRRRAAQPLGRPAGRRAVGGVLVQLRGACPDARPPVRQRTRCTAT